MTDSYNLFVIVSVTALDVDVLGEYMLGIRTMTAEEMEGVL